MTNAPPDTQWRCHISVSLAIEGVSHADETTVRGLEGDEMYDENTCDAAERVTPTVDTVDFDSDVTLELRSYAMARLDFERL